MTETELGLPYAADEARDRTHHHIRDSNGVAIIDVHVRCLVIDPALADQRVDFIVKACNSYHKRDKMLDAACDYLKRCASTDPRDNVTAEEIMRCAIEIHKEICGVTEQDIAESRPEGELQYTIIAPPDSLDVSYEMPDDKAQQAEVADDTAGAIELLTLERDNLEIDMHDALILVAKLNVDVETEYGPDLGVRKFLEQHGVKDGKPPEQLREFVTKHRQEKAEAEAAVVLLMKRFDYKHEPGSLESLCVECEDARERRCGPAFEGSEPCDTFRYFEKQAEEMAPLTRTLERMKA